VFTWRNDPGTDGAGVAFVSALGPGGGRLDLAAGADPADWQVVSATLGVPLFAARQVHGTAVVEVTAATDPAVLAATPADALFTAAPRIGLAVRVADCVPVLVADAAAGLVGAAHAGRVGLVAGVLPALLDALARAGSRAPTAWIGPHICGACYEVPADLREEVAAVLPAAATTTSWGTPALDLGAAAAVQLEAAGCRVLRRDPCTRTTPSLHSHRRDGAAAGRQAGVVWLRVT
jgi:YfiH family protein